MDQESIFRTIRDQLMSILPNLADQRITRDDSLQSFGANSMDRAEIIIETLAAFNLRLPMVRFGQAKNISDIVDVISQGLSEQCASDTTV